jgi:hypothetical protein
MGFDMRETRSPFLVIENFISPLTCEDIVDRIGITFPETDADGRPCKSVTANRLTEIRLADYLDESREFTEEYYGVEIKGIHPLQFEFYPEGCKASPPTCENSILAGGAWRRSNNRDFVGILFLTDYQEKAPFDPSFEVRGGKLQFPTHDFGFNPKRGMLVIFPGNENFVYSTSAVEVGDLHQVKILMTASENYVYDKRSFPGNYEVWFK